MTSTGGTETKARNSTQLQILPSMSPWLTCTMCTSAPEFGNMVESSANTKARNSTAVAPMVQEAMLKGPACMEALRAPNSQPEPMMLPRLAYRSPITPASRRTLSGAVIARDPYIGLMEPQAVRRGDPAILDEAGGQDNRQGISAGSVRPLARRTASAGAGPARPAPRRPGW